MIKKLILSAFIALPAISMAQTNFVIKGNVGSLAAPAKVFLTYRNGATPVTDSVMPSKGAFEFKGSLAAPAQATLVVDHKGIGMQNLKGKDRTDYLNLYLETATIAVNSADSLKKAKISGSRLNDENAAYSAALKPVYDGYRALSAKEKTAGVEVAETEAFKKQQAVEEKALDLRENAVTKKFIQEHPASLISLNALRSYTYSADYVDVEPLFNGLSPELKATPSGKAYAATLEKLKGVAMGKIAPEFAMADTSGKMVALSSFRGKYLLVDFWASWCGPCRAENPNVVKAYKNYKDKNFTILGVSLDRPDAKEKWLKAIHTDGLQWTQLSDLKFWNNDAAQLYGVQAIPQNFLLDPTGKIIGKNLRGDDLVNKLNEVLPQSKKNTKTE